MYKKLIGGGLAAAGVVTVALTGCTSTGTDPGAAPSSRATVSAPTLGEVVPGVNGVPIPPPVVVTDRVTVDGECVRVLRIGGQLYALPERDGDGPLELAPVEAATAVTGCRVDPDPNRR